MTPLVGNSEIISGVGLSRFVGLKAPLTRQFLTILKSNYLPFEELKKIRRKVGKPTPLWGYGFPLAGGEPPLSLKRRSAKRLTEALRAVSRL